MDLYESVCEASNYLQNIAHTTPDIAVILGTGLSEVAEYFNVAHRIPYSQIPHFPISTVESHRGMLIFGEYSGLPFVAMQGRFHSYEGFSLRQVTLPVRVMRALGAKYLLINSAAGGLNPAFKPGDVMAANDHINLLGDNPLRGLIDTRLGERFCDMSAPYDAELLEMAESTAGRAGLELHSGVYTCVSGPSLETRAETRMLRMLGADAVGMSTVPEVIVGAQVGFRTLLLAAITNVNIPEAQAPISLQGVIANAMVAGPKLAKIMGGVMELLSTKPGAE